MVLPSLQPISVNGQRPKKLNNVVGIQTIINKMSASARLKIKRFVDVCMPLFSPMPTSTNEFPIRPRMKNVLNKHIFTIPNFRSSSRSLLVVGVVLILVMLSIISLRKLDYNYIHR